MLFQMLVGVAIISTTAYIHAWALAIAIQKFEPLTRWVRASPTHLRVSTALGASIVWIMGAHLAEVGLWAVAFVALRIFDDLQTAYYFSLVAYTTLGFGDIILPEKWRILSGLVAANGFLIFGWSTAFQVDFLKDLRASRLRDEATESS
ncbi:MAG: ion channel [Pseudomonadota bacterium]